MGQITEMSHWQISQQKKARHNAKVGTKAQAMHLYSDMYWPILFCNVRNQRCYLLSDWLMQIPYSVPQSLLTLNHVSSVKYPECPTKDWWGKSCWLNPWESDPNVIQGPGGVTLSPTLLGPIFVWRQQNYLKLLLGFPSPPMGVAPAGTRLSVWSIRSGRFDLSRFGPAVSVWGHFGHFYTQTADCICLFKWLYRQAKCRASWCYTNSLLRSHDYD